MRLHWGLTTEMVMATKQQHNLLKLVRSPISDGMLPVKLLIDSHKVAREKECKQAMRHTGGCKRKVPATTELTQAG